MPSFREVYGSNYLAARDLPDHCPPAKILDVHLEDFESDRGGDRQKLVMDLEGFQKPLAVNATNAELLGEVLGENYELWPGASIVLVRVKVQFGKQRVDGIRIKDIVKG